MSKGGHGAAAASVLMLKKSEDKRQESALREVFKVRDALCGIIFIKSLSGMNVTGSLEALFLIKIKNILFPSVILISVI